jgi:cupin superfamily acireductone dioxygenase involved in methionine salvage
VNFTVRHSHTDHDLESIAHGEGVFVVVGRSAEIVNSFDGEDWF